MSAVAAKPIVVAVSGRGRLLGHLLKVAPQHGFKVVGVIASNDHCDGYKLAQAQGLPTFVGEFPKAEQQANEELVPQLAEYMRVHQPQLTVLAGFLRPFHHLAHPPAINIHPSLLPKFAGLGLYGMRVHNAVIKSKDKVSGATCHWVSPEYDAGEVIAQAVVPRFADDTPVTLADRVFKAECDLLVTAIEWALNSLATASKDSAAPEAKGSVC